MSIEKEIIWKETHLKKLNALRELNLPLSNKRSPIYISSIKNYSKRVLTIKELLALRYGLDYVLPIVTFDDETFIANIETLFVNLIGHCSDKKDYDECDIDEAIIYNLTPEQLFVANRLRKHCDTFKQHAKKSIRRFKKQTDPIIKTLINLSKDDSIYITRADKGRAVVILDKLDYINKMEKILSDTRTFIRLDSDPTIQKEERLQRKLLKLKDSGFITENEYYFARPVGSQPGKAYGLPKIHKDCAPLRPIISACNTFSYKLSKLLAKKLKHLRTNPSIVTDTFKFVDELKNLEFTNEKIKMVSFDVVSLFTKVPLARTTQLILEKMYGPEHTCLYDKEMKQDEWCTNCKHRSELKWLLDTATKESHFLFNKKIYRQIDDLALVNDYPLRFIECQIKKTLNRYLDKSNKLNNSNNKQTKSVDNSSKGPQILIDLPYIGKQTNNLSKQIIGLAKVTRPGLHIQPISRPPRSVTSFFPGNDKTPKDYQSNV
ncbi:unnamed protein product, partial [Rotaria sp. Silwood1]